MTIVEVARPVTGGVDTHLDVHVAAALDHIGGLLGVESFPTTQQRVRPRSRCHEPQIVIQQRMTQLD